MAKLSVLHSILVVAVTLAGCAEKGEMVEVAEPRPPVETRAEVDRAVATTGDLITYRVTVDFDQAFEVEIAEPGADIAGFRIVDIGREEPRRRAGRVIEEQWYELRADLVGSYILPPVVVSFGRNPEVDAEGDDRAESSHADWETVETSAIFVEVESVLAADEEATDIRGVKPLRRVKGPVPWIWLAGTAAVVVLLAMAVIFYLRYRRRPSELIPEPPHEVAFRELDALRATDFADPEAVRRFHFALSEILRIYVEGRYGLNATDLTTDEILSALPQVSDLEEADGQSLELFLVDTDQVKFADHRPSEPEIETNYERALGFVEATQPVATEEEAA